MFEYKQRHTTLIQILGKDSVARMRETCDQPVQSTLRNLCEVQGWCMSKRKFRFAMVTKTYQDQASSEFLKRVSRKRWCLWGVKSAVKLLRLGPVWCLLVANIVFWRQTQFQAFLRCQFNWCHIKKDSQSDTVISNNSICAFVHWIVQ